MKTSDAQKMIREMVNKGQLSFSKENGLILTEKAAGIRLELLAELSIDQASRIGQEFDSLFETRKRVSSLLRKGVSADTLRTLLAEIEGKTAGTPTTEPAKDGENAEDNQGQLVLPGNASESPTGGTDTTEGHPTAETEAVGGQSGANDSVREGVNSGTNRRPSNRSGVNQPGGTV